MEYQTTLEIGRLTIKSSGWNGTRCSPKSKTKLRWRAEILRRHRLYLTVGAAAMERRMTRSIFITSFSLAVLGGIYFGLFACGGYVWHSHVFQTVFLGLLALATFLPPYSMKRIATRVSVAVAIVIVFAVTEAATTCFYPLSPDSWSEFLRGFLLHLKNGPC